ncbi:hypothetical protein, partial [Streptomyces thermospinosisporus]
SEHFGLEPRGADFRLGDYDTLDKVADLIHQELGARRGDAAPVAPDGGERPVVAGVPGREEVWVALRGLYAQALEYP